MNLVVEASVAVKWFVPELTVGQQAEHLLGGGDALSSYTLLLLIEFGNIVWKKVQGG